MVPNRLTQARDYWILRFSRDVSAIIVFFVTLLVQVTVSRVLVFTLACAIVLLILGHVLTSGKYFPKEFLKRFLQPTGWSKDARLLVWSYIALLTWVTVTFIWSPLPGKGIKDLALLVVIVPLIYMLAIEQSKIIMLPFLWLLRLGLVVASLLLISEMSGITSFHSMGDTNARLYDLNRNAVLISLLCWTIILFGSQGFVRKFLYFFLVLLVGVAVFFSESEAVKLSFVVSLITGVLVNYKPSRTLTMRNRKLGYDLYYIYNRSVFLDILIWFRTFQRLPNFFISIFRKKTRYRSV